jgi:hypothetical protein
MPGLVPGIHEMQRSRKQDVDGRVKPGHDGLAKAARFATSQLSDFSP